MKQLCIILLALCAGVSVFARDNVKKDLSAKQLLFIENKGQVVDQHSKHRSDIDFKLESSGVTIFIGDGQLHYQWTKQLDSTNIESYRLDVLLQGANKKAELITEEKTEYYENYYLPQCPDGATAHSYKKITYKNVYPKIDWVLYSNGRELKYDFVVHKGGDAKNIKLQYNGATKLNIQDGVFTATTPFGSVTEQKPFSYDAATKKEVASSFSLKENTVSFNVAKHEGDVVIDPTLQWATYFGGSSTEIGHVVKCDLSGFANVVGVTLSTANIATSGAHQTTLGGTYDGFLARFAPNGSLQWATYYGGGGYEWFTDVTTDGSSNIYMAGTTMTQSGLASSGAHKTAIIITTFQDADAILIKFNSSGIRQWATYYGGLYQEEETTKVACDAAGNVYLSGNTRSDTGITTAGSHRPTYTANPGNNAEGFIVKFNSGGVRQWGTYYGSGIYSTSGTNDPILDICVDNTGGNIFVCGFTRCDTGIATTGAFQTSRPPGYNAGFIAKFNSNGVRQWGTYYGGGTAGGTSCVNLASDNYGNVYIDGASGNNPNLATPGAYMATIAPGFITKFNSSGARIWGTYYVDGFYTTNGHLSCDTTGNLFIASAVPANFTNIATPCGIQPSQSGIDGVIMNFDSSGAKIYATYFGGTSLDHFHAACWDIATGAVYATGKTQSTGIATTGAYQTSLNGILDATVVKYTLDTSVYIRMPFTDTLLCAGDTLKVRYGTMFSYQPGNVFSIQLSNASGSFASPTTIGSVTATKGGTITCVIPTSTAIGNGYKIRIVSTSPVNVPCNDIPTIGIGAAPPSNVVASLQAPTCVADTVRLLGSSTSTGITSWSWAGPNNYVSAIQNPIISNVPSTASGIYTLTAAIYGCRATDTANVALKPLPGKPDAITNAPICAGDTLKLFATDTSTGVSYSWIGPDVFSSNIQNPYITNATTVKTGSYIVTATKNGCFLKDTVVAVVNNYPAIPIANNNSPICAGDTLKLTSSTTTTGVVHSWAGPNSFGSAAKDTNILNATTARSGSYIISVTKDGCTSKDTTDVLVKPVPALLSKSSNSPVCPGLTLNLNCAYNISGVSYSWSGPTSFSSTSQAPSRTSMTTADAGQYIVNASLNGCTSPNDTLQVVVSPSTPAPVATANSPVCVGQDLKLYASTIAGATYSWTGPGSFNTTTQNPTRTSALPSYTGTYYVTATLNNCTSTAATVNVNVLPAPDVTVYPSPNDSICQGATLTLVSNISNAGSPAYQWYKNNTFIPGGISKNYVTSTAADLDEYYCTITVTGICTDPYRDTSNPITMRVFPWLAPSVTITANPSGTVSSGSMITFTAKPVNGGNVPKYQWKRNSTDVVGAISSTWGAATLSNKDLICVEMTSNYMCPNPTKAMSNCITVSMETSSITGVDWKNNPPKVYPNPVNETLTIEGITKGTQIQLMDVLGRIVISQTATKEIETLNTSSLVPGNYMLRLNGADNSMSVKIVKK